MTSDLRKLLAENIDAHHACLREIDRELQTGVTAENALRVMTLRALERVHRAELDRLLLLP